MSDLTDPAALSEDLLMMAVVLFPGVTLLDFIGPTTALGFHADVHLVAASLAPVRSDQGISVLPTMTFADCPDDLDILFVPGGMGVIDAMVDDDLLEFLRVRAATSGFVTSVCTGSLILGAAGLLAGFKATTHWGWLDVLPALGAIPTEGRVVTDGNRVTGGGVTAGIDFGLELLAQLRGEDAARTVQLMMEYDPAPAFDAGSPDKATPPVLEAAATILNTRAECAVMIERALTVTTA